MIYRVEIWARDGFGDPHAAGVLSQIKELGIDCVTAVKHARIFFLGGRLSQSDVEKISAGLLVDPVTESYRIGQTPDKGKCVVEVHLQPGVMDPVAESCIKAIGDMGFDIQTVSTARRYELTGDVSDEQRETIARRLLANAVIEDTYFKGHTPSALNLGKYKLKIIEVPIRNLDDAGLMELSKKGDLFLNLTEMKAIRNYFRKLGREARDIELEMIAQTWSEHCGHKTFRSDVKVRNSAGEIVEEIPNLLKSTVFKSTMELNKPWCLNVFADNAGVIDFDDDTAVCFKVETHNHPSAIEPYGGSMTGIGGVVRDPLGTGLGAKPIANTDVFCFGDTTMKLSDVPTGVLHPKRVMRGVVSGVRDYGNRMGIPTVNGAVYFDERYLGNPLVFCGTIAVMPKNKCFKQHPKEGNAIVCLGGRTGRDGIHGATFSSGELTHKHETKFSHAVQIGNAITEKKVLDVLMQARDRNLFDCITDCGAGGLSSAIGEMGEKIGAEVHLDRVPLKYAGLSYSEIWISEAQERMVLSVPQENVDEILKLFASENVEAQVLGRYGVRDDDGHPVIKLYYEGASVGQMDMEFLHDGTPKPTKDALWDFKPMPTILPDVLPDFNQILLKILAMPNVASKEWVIRQYDHEVQGGSAVKPLVGAAEDGPGDAAVIRPKFDSQKAVALSCGMNPLLGDLHPYQSALHAVDEALRNIVAVGGNLSRTALLDNFCWGNCNKPDRMGTLVQSAKACHDAALAYGTPFVSGKDSLNNEFQTDKGETIAIPATLLISAMSVLDDAGKCVTSDAKTAGNLLFIVGKTRDEMGGSHYLQAVGLKSGNDVPPVNCAANLESMKKLQQAIEEGLVRACHDLSEGGLAVAAAEMAFSGELGVELSLADLPADGNVSLTAKLFGESAGRFLVEVTPANEAAFTAVMSASAAKIGKVTDSDKIVIDNIIDLSAKSCKAAWQGTFRW